MKENSMILKVLRLLVYSALLSASIAQAQLVNGNFATGDFTGWGIANTPVNGYGENRGGTFLAQVAPFDITGTGVTVNSAEFEVGETGPTGPPSEGIELYQYVALNSGMLAVSFNLASYSLSNNGDGGLFQLLIDGNDVADFAVGGIQYQQTIRSSLSYTGIITGGTHQIGVNVLRNYAFAGDDTPIQFLSDFQLTNTPEPPASALLLAGAAALFFVRRVRR